MARPFEIYSAVKAAILHFYCTPDADASQKNALTSLTIIYTLYMGAEQLGRDVVGLDDIRGKAAVLNYTRERDCLLLTGGVFMPEESDGSHLKPAAFIKYTQIGMKFFIDRWETANRPTRIIMIAQLLAHDTLTYPRLVSYIQRWAPPDQTDLFLTITSWLYSDMNDAFTAAENTVNRRTEIGRQIVAKYQTMRDDKKTYCVFWGSLLTIVDRTFSLGFKQEPLFEKIRANRTCLHQVFMGYISTQEIDIFIDHCFLDVYNWTVLGPDGDDD